MYKFKEQSFLQEKVIVCPLSLEQTRELLKKQITHVSKNSVYQSLNKIDPNLTENVFVHTRFLKTQTKFTERVFCNFNTNDCRLGILQHRSQFQKHTLRDKFEKFYDSNKTEFQIMKDAGYMRIWDCGNYVLEWSSVTKNLNR